MPRGGHVGDLLDLRDPARLGAVGLHDGDRARFEQPPHLLPAVVVLSRRKGDEGPLGEVAVRPDRVRRERLLQPVHPVVLAVRDDLHEVLRGVAGLGVHRDVEPVPEVAPHPGDPLRVALRSVPDPELDGGIAAVDEPATSAASESGGWNPRVRPPTYARRRLWVPPRSR